MTAGDIYTVAGTGTYGYSGDGGPATSAEIKNPLSVAVDAHGNLLIDDQHNNRIRLVAAGTGTFYGQAMTAGDIYTVAGDGTVRVRRRPPPGHQRRAEQPAGRGGGPGGRRADRRPAAAAGGGRAAPAPSTGRR